MPNLGNDSLLEDCNYLEKSFLEIRMKNNEELCRRVASLENHLDQVEMELSYLNQLLLESGFPEGVKTLKATIEEFLSDIGDPFQLPPEDLPPTQTFDPFG